MAIGSNSCDPAASAAGTGDSCVSVQVHEYRGGSYGCRSASVVQEVEVGVRLNGQLAYEINCSPWNVRECVAGSLFFRGAIGAASDMKAFSYEDGIASVETAEVAGDSLQVGGAHRNRRRPSPLPREAYPCRLTADEVNGLIGLLEDGSHLFHRTGGVHSAAVATRSGVVARQEDVSRQAALDKLMGACLLEGIDPAGMFLLFSGRMPHSIVSRVVLMGCPVVISPGAPTDLSLELAHRCGVTLVGFAKNGCFNAYTHIDRVVADDRPSPRKAG